MERRKNRNGWVARTSDFENNFMNTVHSIATFSLVLAIVIIATLSL